MRHHFIKKIKNLTWEGLISPNFFDWDSGGTFSSWISLVKEGCAMKGKPQFNHEGYRDPVPYKAIRKLEQDYRKQQALNRPKRRGGKR
jgi:hypothetical protein